MHTEERDEAAAINACIEGAEAVIRRIFGSDAANRPLCGGQLPIHLAAAAGNVVALETLWKMGASLNAVGNHVSANAPLHLAILAQRYAATQLLLALGAEVDIANGVGTAPLQDAARLNDTRAGAILLAAGADPTLQNGYGNTVLHRVCYFGHQDWLVWLSQTLPAATWSRLAALQNAAGLNAADVAASHERFAIVDFLRARGLEVSQPLSRLRGLRYSERRRWLELLAPQRKSA